MRPFEILLSLLLIILPLTVIIRPLARVRWLFPTLSAALALVLLLQYLLERLRWQLIPFYFLALFWLIVALRKEFAEPAESQPAKPRHRMAWLGLILAVIFLAPPILLPVPQLPQPTGRYAVGTTVFYWEDPSRPELYTDELGDSRRLMVQVWYPADAQAGAALAPYIDNPDVALPALAKKFKIPAFLLSHLDLAKTHSLLDAPVVDSVERQNLAPLDANDQGTGDSGTSTGSVTQFPTFPVVIFSHGWTGIRVQNTFQMEELASQGYIVFSADHTYGAMYTVFPDGTVALNKRDALGNDQNSDAEYDLIARVLGQVWVGDLRFVLDQAEKVNSGEIASPLAGRLDLSRVGMLGHSTGGGAVVEACASDPRCDAGLSMDAWLIPYDRALVAEGLDKPFFFMQSESWSLPRNPDLQAALFSHMRAPAYRMILLGASHYDFSDIPLITPLAPLIGLKGPIPAARSLTIINQFTVAFFDRYLKGIPAPLLEDAGGISEINLEFRE